jgi:hypothetical protein
MDRHAALILLCAATASAAPKTTAKKGPAMHVRSIDLPRRYVLIELTGISRPPAPNLYTFTDVRDRHYVALNVSCEKPFPSGTMVCELQIPDGYERHQLAQLELHLGGLHSRTIAAPAAEIAAAWAAGMTAQREPSPSPSPSPLPKPMPRPSPRPSPKPAAKPAPSPSPKPHR